jgi:hypothetical protein
MSRWLVSFFIFICFLSCRNQNDSFKAKLIDIIIQEKNGQVLEFPELYDSLANNTAFNRPEISFLVEDLKKRGFILIDSGYGNYPPIGPRIVSYDLKKGSCKCTVNKIYYSTRSVSQYRVSESIKCEN